MASAYVRVGCSARKVPVWLGQNGPVANPACLRANSGFKCRHRTRTLVTAIRFDSIELAWSSNGAPPRDRVDWSRCGSKARLAFELAGCWRSAPIWVKPLSRRRA